LRVELQLKASAFFEQRFAFWPAEFKMLSII